MPQPPPSPAGGGHGFGTLPVFLAALSTILGAVMFLRFGYAVGQLGLAGTLGVIVLGHLVTVPTALAISEIATNRKVEGGGEYFLISRSFGTRIGAAIGISLYVSQAISVAFYCIAFAEAFVPLAPGFESLTGLVFDRRFVSLPVCAALVLLILTKGAALGVKALYVVVAVLTASLVLFFLGSPLPDAPLALDLHARVGDSDGFFVVFAICFPAFTGMTAGVGLSGDLARPARSIPLGTLLGTFVGLLVYVGLVYKLSISAPPELLANNPLVMADIALWPAAIPLGLACATLSSALGSMLVAPRTLQALGKDGVFLLAFTNRWLARGRGENNEPRLATLVTALVALTFVSLGDVDFVARLISMFFMVTYGALCTVSFLEHFAASPGYRPSFRSRWYLSLLGAVLCVLLMLQMDPVFALLSMAAMGLFYWLTRFTPAGETNEGLAALFRGVMTQLIRRLLVQLQRTPASTGSWRPSLIMLDSQTFEGDVWPRQLLGWLSARQGFGTYLHYIQGLLGPETARERRRIRRRLVELQGQELRDVYVEVMVSPSTRSALAQALQMPGISGVANNIVLFELAADDPPERVSEVHESARFAAEVGRSVLILRHSEVGFRQRRNVHLWLTWDDDRHAPLMVMLAYVLLGHDDWRHATVHVLAALPRDRVTVEQRRFVERIEGGRLPISRKNIAFIPVDSAETFREVIRTRSADADLVLRGLSHEALAAGPDCLARDPSLPMVLFVLAAEEIELG